MIKQEHKFTEATCDGCGKDLLHWFDDGCATANYGALESYFGWGSSLDRLAERDLAPRYEICEECWLKALAAIGITKS